MPQIDQLFETFGSQLFWLLITFGFVYIVIGRGMLPKIQSTVDMREKRIADDLEAARIAHARSDELEEEHAARQREDRDAAQAITAAAKQEAAQHTEAKLKTVNEEIDGQLEAADAALAEQRKSALSEIESVAAEAAQAIVAKLTSNKVTKAKARTAVKGALRNG